MAGRGLTLLQMPVMEKKLAPMPEESEAAVGDWEESAMSSFPDVLSSDDSLLGGGLKRMFGGMSKAESMPNLNQLDRDDDDDLSDPFEYDDDALVSHWSGDLGGLDRFGAESTSGDIMDLDKDG